MAVIDGAARREGIVKLLESEMEPISGTSLAKRFEVSRQVIVQDIALLRVSNKNILSTNKGYIIYGHQTTKKCKRIISVWHSDEQMLEELYTIVDCGAHILDVIIEHDVYGQIAVDLMIASRKDADDFIKKITHSRAKPLKELTGGGHFHTIEAGEERILDKVEETLTRKGLLRKI